MENVYCCYNCRFNECDKNSGKCSKCLIGGGFSVPSEWMVMTDAQKLEREFMDKSSQQLHGDITNIYKYEKVLKKAAENIKSALNSEYGLVSIKAKEVAMTRIEKVIFNNPATIVFWYDGTKTVVKCGEGEAFDPEKGLAMAISKRFFNNSGWYYDVFKKWLPEDED